MRPLFLAAGQAPPPRTLVVDCGLRGDATYSHWRDAPLPPPELAADSSTAMLCAAAADPACWLAGFDHVANDHVDADGLLAMAAACRPEVALRHRELLIGAAEAGDFGHWPGEPAFRLMLRVHRHIADAKETGDGWEQLAADLAVDQLPALIAESADERFAAVARRVQAQRASLARDVQLTVGERVVAYAWMELRGHATDSFLWTGEPDDLPPWVHDGLGSPRHFHLLAMTGLGDSGILYQLLAPGHSWARTVRRPHVGWPDLGALARELQRQEHAPGRWVCGAEARHAGFVCQLAFVHANPANRGLLRPSSLTLAAVLPLVERALAGT